MSVKFVLSTLCVASLCSASALGACKPQLSDLDESFGVGQLGRPYTELLPAIKPLEFSQRGDPRCVGVNRTRFDCQFVDASGIFYEDDGEGLILKSIDVTEVRDAFLPFGITSYDRLDDVIKKTKPFRKRDFKVEKEGLYTYYLSDDCYVNGRGEVFSVNIWFDHEGYFWAMNVTAKKAKLGDPYQ